jgi:hypothetical protein
MDADRFERILKMIQELTPKQEREALKFLKKLILKKNRNAFNGESPHLKA